MSGRREETPYEEAAELSAIRGSAIPQNRDGDDDFDDFDDPDIADLNNPDVEALAEPPLIGARPKPVDLGFGDEAQAFGRATSPKLYASAAQFPTAVQFRVWRWENGVPVGLGAIDAEATEEDFVRAFMQAMPKPGQGNFQFRMRPIDIRGQELGKEFTINISEHHATLRQLRELKKAEEEERMNGGGGWGRGPGGDIIVHGGGQDQVGASYAEEMGRMFEQAVESAEEQNRVLRESLEMERDRLRDEEKTRAEERVSMAERSAVTVEKMMERLMSSDRNRSEEQMKAQKDHSSFMMSTLTQVFAQQQEAARQQSERIREQDGLRMQQDREFYDRQRQEAELRRSRERDEIEAKRRAEKEEFEARRRMEREEAERRRRTDMEEWERKRSEERERLEMEQRRWEESRKQEAEQMRLETQRRESELERRRETEREENRLRLEREKMELEARRDQLREEREQARREVEERRQREQREFERKMQAEREDRERRERADRERWERERSESERKRDEERREWERREQLRREELQRESERRQLQAQQEAERRREEMQLQMKQMEANAQRDREHAERMSEMARLEREAQREAAMQREKAEREAREAGDRERQRAFELQKFEMEQAKERDREHAERMIQMSKIQNSGGLSGITDMLGMDTPEVLSKIFGGGAAPEGDGGWSEAIPKVLGAIAEVGAKTLGAKPPPRQVQGRRPAARVEGKQQKLIPIQTPEGIKMISPEMLARIQAARGQMAGIPMPVEDDDDFETDLPINAFEPDFGDEGGDASEGQAAAPLGATREQAPATSDTLSPDEVTEGESKVTPEYIAASRVDPIKRAKASGMKFSKQRAARRAIRVLMPKLEAASEEEWVGVVTEALVKEPAIYEYLKNVTVYVALVEAKVEPDVVEKTVGEMKESGMIPDEVPYDEADYKRLQGSGQTKQEEATSLETAPVPPSWPDTADSDPSRHGTEGDDE